ALTVVGLDRTGNDLTVRVRNQTTHTGDLPDLHPVAASTRGDHPVHRVVRDEVALHGLGHLVGGFVPDLHQFLTALVVGEQTTVVLSLHLAGAGLVGLEDLGL